MRETPVRSPGVSSEGYGDPDWRMFLETMDAAAKWLRARRSFWDKHKFGVSAVVILLGVLSATAFPQLTWLAVTMIVLGIVMVTIACSVSTLDERRAHLAIPGVRARLREDLRRTWRTKLRARGMLRPLP